MLRGIVVLAVLLAGLVVWDRALADEREAVRGASGRLEKLLDDAQRAGLVVAAVRVETAQGESFLYARARGVWRLLEPPVNTYVDQYALGGLMQSLLDAEGVVLTKEKLRAKSYGFGGDVALRVTLHGTGLQKDEDQDVLFGADLGFAIQGTDGCYVRPLGTHEVWAVDQNPRTFLTRPPGSSFPPMLDPYVLPVAFAATLGGFTKIEVERARGESYVLERGTDPALDSADPAASADFPGGDSWVLVRADGRREACHPVPVTGYTIFLLRATYERIVGPADLDPAVADRPAVRLVLHPVQGEPFELLLGEPERSGGRVLVNLGTQTAFGLSPETADLLAPTPEVVSRVEAGNPWHEFIQVNPAAGINPLLDPLQRR